MATQKEIAEFFRLALRVGLVDTAAVERWVDSVIAEEPVVSFPFTELAGASHLRPSNVDELLGQVNGSGEAYVHGHLLLALFRRRIRDNALAPEAAIKSALEVARQGALAEAECYRADHLDDSVWLATNDTYGTLDQVRGDIIEFFEKYAEFEEQIPMP